MNQIQNKPGKKKVKYRGFEKSERLFPSAFLAVTLPFTLLFFGPFEMFNANHEQLSFAFGDFIWPLFFLALVLSAALFCLLWLLKGRAFDIVYGILVGIVIMLFLQSSFLNLGLTSLPGDGVGVSEFTTLATVINTVIWIAVLAAIPVLLSVFIKGRDIVRLVLTVLTLAVLGGQLISFAIYSLTTPVMAPPSERIEVSSDDGNGENEATDDGDTAMRKILTTKNLTTLSSQENVILIIVDRFDLDFYHNMLNKDPQFFSELEGFVSYENNISKYARTYPSVAYMLTGVENDFSSSQVAYFDKAYREKTLLRTLKDNGYDINLYLADGDCYSDAEVFGDLVSNSSSAGGYEILDRSGLCLCMLRLSLFRQLPVIGKDVIGTINSSTFNSYVSYDAEYPLYTTDMKDVYDILTADEFELQDNAKSFVCLHFDGCHSPFIYDENWNVLSDDDPRRDDYSKAEIGMISSFAIINRYLGEMKRLGIYEDSTVIITGDHAAAYSDTKDLSGSRVTSLLVKEKGASSGKITNNYAPVSQDNLIATILDSAGVVTEEDFGVSIFDVKETDGGKRYYYFQKTVIGGYDEIVVYEVVGDASDFKNWTIVDRYSIKGAIS